MLVDVDLFEITSALKEVYYPIVTNHSMHSLKQQIAHTACWCHTHSLTHPPLDQFVLMSWIFCGFHKWVSKFHKLLGIPFQISFCDNFVSFVPFLRNAAFPLFLGGTPMHIMSLVPHLCLAAHVHSLRKHKGVGGRERESKVISA